MTEYKQVTIKARDIEQGVHAFWCQIGDSEPRWIPVALVRPHSGGAKVCALLDTFNCCVHGIDDEIEVGEALELSRHTRENRARKRSEFLDILAAEDQYP